MDPELRLDTQLCFALYSASRKVTSAYREPLSKMGLTYPQYLVLLVLWEQDHRTVNQLGEALMLDSGTLSPLLRRMENAGFVTRRRSEQDERSVVVSLTSTGRALEKDAAGMQENLLDSLDMSTRDRLALHGLARKLCRVL
ncbi:MarR family transcriptional regulator [Kocuria rhizophila]|uniref:MarR family winged helix-turn-helix transcriptional regulator n=1 Tax=Kocuria rhizophila TaxID=72000 RepID=UPI0021A56F6C|nr:MarR family transcriptional regulator [Kocuria rhizophila]MCT1879322.1 MarR family transcriptional regulator [Kocuria rhizophila]